MKVIIQIFFSDYDVKPFYRPGDSFGFQVEQIILVFSEDVSKHSTIAVKALGFQL